MQLQQKDFVNHLYHYAQAPEEKRELLVEQVQKYLETGTNCYLCKFDFDSIVKSMENIELAEMISNIANGSDIEAEAINYYLSIAIEVAKDTWDYLYDDSF